MNEEQIESLRFPIGQYEWPKIILQSELSKWIKSIHDFPESLAKLTHNVTLEQLNTPYRPDGWNLKQVVHHCADSHMSCLKRFKLALTEDAPTIRPYPEHLFAELIDSKDDDISDSMAIIKAVHHKWVNLLNNMSTADFERTFIHPEGNETIKLSEATGLYAWHSEHHLGHVKLCLLPKNK